MPGVWKVKERVVLDEDGVVGKAQPADSEIIEVFCVYLENNGKSLQCFQ